MNTEPHYLTRDQVNALMEERDILLEQVRQLQEALAPDVVLPASWRLTRTEETFLRAVRAVGPKVLHRERAMLALYGMSQDAPSQKILDVHLFNVRKKLMRAQAQIHIEAVWGRGWRLSAESCAQFDAAVKADAARWDVPARAVA